jgi:hypothetical protein
MRFLLASIGIAAVVAVAPTLALGAKPERGYHSDSFTETNFCGTGTSVDVFFESIFTASERDGGFKVEHQGSFTYTYGDASVIVSFAGQFTDTIVATGPGGVEIHQLISKGIPVKIQLENGPVLAVDAGASVVLITVQNGNVVNEQIVSLSGHYPVLVGGVFCTVVPQALGIT